MEENKKTSHKSGKGAEFERQICKTLSKGITGTDNPVIFWRCASSGGIYTRTKGAAGSQFSADIGATDPKGAFLTNKISIECKNGYPGASLDNFLKINKNDPLKDFGTQANRDAEKSNKSPFLVYKKKGMPVIWLGIREEIFDKIYEFIKDKRYIKLNWTELPIMVILSFTDFLENVTAEQFEKILTCF